MVCTIETFQKIYPNLRFEPDKRHHGKQMKPYTKNCEMDLNWKRKVLRIFSKNKTKTWETDKLSTQQLKVKQQLKLAEGGYSEIIYQVVYIIFAQKTINPTYQGPQCSPEQHYVILQIKEFTNFTNIKYNILNPRRKGERIIL